MRPGSFSVLAIALGVFALGPVLLGLDWHGHEASPGVWRDGVALWQWGLLWGVLTVGGATMAGRLPSPATRVVAVTPLLLWCGWMLRTSALGPLAWLVYAVPLLLAWLGGTLLGDMVRRRMARPVKHPEA